MRIEFRFGLILAFCFLLGVGVAGYISYTLEYRQAREEVTEKANVLLNTALSVRRYTVDEISPLVLKLADTTQFHPQMVPSYGAQSVMRRLHAAFPDYSYRESSLNPTNVADRASDWDVGLFRSFQRDANLKELSGEVGSGADRRFYVSRPIRLTDPACLQCHSTPAAAPPAMIAQYGGLSGFHWRLGDIIGLQLVEVPEAPTEAKAFSGVLVTVGSLTCVFIITSAIFLLLLRRHVTDPLAAITRAAEAISHDHRPHTPEGDARMDRQFHDLQQSIIRLKTSLDQALRELGGKPDPSER